MDSELGTFSDVIDPFRIAPDNVVNLSGAKIPFSPEFTGNIGLAYDIKLGDLTLTPRVDFSHQDETQAALWDTPMVTLEARDLINAQIALGTGLRPMVGGALGHQHHGRSSTYRASRTTRRSTMPRRRPSTGCG